MTNGPVVALEATIKRAVRTTIRDFGDIAV